jgi:DNA-binding response OmpR family regulator
MATILVVDDDVDVSITVKKSLTRVGYQVTCAGTGQAALQVLSSVRPDLVLLDIAMPGLDGIELCRQLRLNPITASLPILFLTVSGDMQSKTAAFDAGADDYLVKPFDLQELNLRVKALLLREQAANFADDLAK